MTKTPLPTIGNDDYLVKVHAVTVTGTELLWARPPERTISVPGVEVAGRIVVAPASSSRFAVGDEIYARTKFDRPGNAREYTVVREAEMALAPKNLTPTEAVTVPMSAQTAWQALFVQGGLKAPGSGAGHNSSTRVLVNGASGGTGVWLVQLAKHAGAQVVGTCGPSNVEFVRSLGADTVLNYRTTALAQWAEEDPKSKVDLVVDCVGGQSLINAWKTVKDGGLVVTIVPPADSDYKWDLSPPEGVSETIKGKFFIMELNSAQLEQCTRWIEEGKAKAVTDSVWEFEDWKKAFERVDSGHARGKVVLRVES